MKVNKYTSKELEKKLIDKNNLSDPYFNYHYLSNRLRFFKHEIPNNIINEEFHYFCVEKNNEIIAVLKLKEGGNYSLKNNKYNNWISYISVNKDFKNKGYSKILIEECFKYLKKNKKEILVSGYTKEGFQKLKKTIKDMSKKYEVNYSDEDKVTYSF